MRKEITLPPPNPHPNTPHPVPRGPRLRRREPLLLKGQSFLFSLDPIFLSLLRLSLRRRSLREQRRLSQGTSPNSSTRIDKP